jgi:hypothetical protein
MFWLDAILEGLTDFGKTIGHCQRWSLAIEEKAHTDDISVDEVGQEDGSRFHAVLLGNLQDDLFLHQRRTWRTQRGVGLEDDTIGI